MMDRSRFLASSDDMTPYASDRPVGVVLMVFAAIGIPFHMFAGIASGFWHLLHIFGDHSADSMAKSGANGSLFGTMFTVALLAGLVFAGYGISHSRRIAFLVAIPLGVLAVLFHAGFPLGLAFAIYGAMRLKGALRSTAPRF